MSCIPTNQELGLPKNATDAERREKIRELGGFQGLETGIPRVSKKVTHEEISSKSE